MRHSFLHCSKHIMSAVDISTYCRKFIFERVTHKALRSKMIDLIRLNCVYYVEYASKAFQRRSVENELVENMPYAPESVLRIFNSNSPNNAVDLIALFQKKLCKVRTILAGYTCYEGFFHSLSPSCKQGALLLQRTN